MRSDDQREVRGFEAWFPDPRSGKRVAQIEPAHIHGLRHRDREPARQCR
jgi:hypothetical protein